MACAAECVHRRGQQLPGSHVEENVFIVEYNSCQEGMWRRMFVGGDSSCQEGMCSRMCS